MPLRIDISPHARRALDKLPKGDFRTIDDAIMDLADQPRPHGIKKLGGSIHRIRVGRFRVIYLIGEREGFVSILDVARRSEKTYRAWPR